MSVKPSNTQAAECARCHEAYSLRDGCEPSEFCDRCVHDVVDGLRSRIATLEEDLAGEAATSQARLEALQRIARAVGVEGSLMVAEQVERRIAKFEAANAALVDLCEEYEAQWGDDYLAKKWGLKESLKAIKGASLSADNCVCYLWPGTCAMHAQGLEREQGGERLCARCGCEYVPDRLCSESGFTLMCRDPGPLPDSKEET